MKGKDIWVSTGAPCPLPHTLFLWKTSVLFMHPFSRMQLLYKLKSGCTFHMHLWSVLVVAWLRRGRESGSELASGLHVCLQLFAVFIFSEFQVRPGVVSVGNRQNQLPTLLFKNGTVVPIQQASGQLIDYYKSIICVLKYSGVIVQCLIPFIIYSILPLVWLPCFQLDF